MARYHEKILSLPQTVVFMLLAFLTVLAPWALGDQELTWREAFVLVQSQGLEMAPLPLVTVYGEAIPNAYPLFPILAKLVNLLGCPAELCTRVLSLLSLLGISVLVFAVAAGNRKNLSAGACSGAVSFSCLLALDKSNIGLSNILTVLVIFSGHLIWYYYAAVRGDWRRAHLGGFAACALGFYLNGIAAVIFFLLPLVFMRRPLGVFRRLNSRWVLLGTVLLLLVMLAWNLPYHTGSVRIAQHYPRANFMDNYEYLQHLLTFPLDLMLRMFPWVLLAWAPFCVAFQTLDETPLFSRFLRTIFLANFFLLWLMPIDEIHWWFILLPPLAVLTGLYYELNIRRYGNVYRGIANFSAAVLLPGSAVILLVFFLVPSAVIADFLPLERSLAYSDNFGASVLACAAAAVLLVLSALLLRIREKPPVWCYLLLIIIGPMMVYNCIVRPYRAQEHWQRDNADVFNQALQQEAPDETAVIYKYTSRDLYVQSVYMNRRFVNINSLSELPGSEVPVIYMFAENYPPRADRSWRSLLPEPENIRGNKINIWRGEWQSKTSERPQNTPLLDGLKPLPGWEDIL